jgi:hypothetical protein
MEYLPSVPVGRQVLVRSLFHQCCDEVFHHPGHGHPRLYPKAVMLIRYDNDK